MQVTVFGANGKVGQLVVAELLTRKYDIVAFVHNESQLANNAKLRTIQGDVYNADQVAEALSGSDAVVSALSSWGTPRKDVLSAAMAHIIPTMAATGTKRIISLTGADARVEGDAVSVMHVVSHALISVIAGKVLHDGEKHIELLRKSQLDWTVLRSPVMIAKNSTVYKLGAARPSPWSAVPRRAVAQAIADQIEADSHLRQSPFITS